MTATADLTKVLDKEYQDKSLAEIVAASVAALKGVSESDAALLAQAFNIKTVGDLGTNKFFRAAYALATLADSAG